jgi:hypothetical protein
MEPPKSSMPVKLAVAAIMIAEKLSSFLQKTKSLG